MLDVKKQVMELGKRISDWNGEPCANKNAP